MMRVSEEVTMKKYFFGVLAAVFAATLLCLTSSAAVSATPIYTADDLLAVADDLDGSYELANDIDMTDVKLSGIGSVDAPFTGELDGCGFKITGLTVSNSSSDTAYAALVIANEGNIHDIVFENATITASGVNNTYAAVACALNHGTVSSITITKSEVKASSTYFGARAGGVVAYNFSDGLITASESGAKVSASSKRLYSDAAGIAAINIGEITDCTNSGAIESTSASCDASAGGIVATNMGTVARADNSASIIAYTTRGKGYANGIAANDTGSVTGCTSTGTAQIKPASNDITCGDVNGDGNIGPLDSTMLSRYLGNWIGYADSIDLSAADVNADGYVNTIDGIVLSRAVGKWKDYETLPYLGNK